jgi:hypothetical protein
MMEYTIYVHENSTVRPTKHCLKGGEDPGMAVWIPVTQKERLGGSQFKDSPHKNVNTLTRPILNKKAWCGGKHL